MLKIITYDTISRVKNMRKVNYQIIKDKLTQAITNALYTVDFQVISLIKEKRVSESSSLACWALDKIIENDLVARETNSFPCQDTGMAIVFINFGQDVFIEGGLINDAVNDAVKDAYSLARKSILDPITRKNTLDNTPAIIHTQIVKGNKIEISFMAKGAGSENMGRLYMLTPSKGIQGILDSVLDCVKKAGANPCPPIIIGVGVGGDMEKACELAKHSLLREPNSSNQDPQLDLLEKEILSEVNNLKIGAQGLKGDTTCLAVMIEKYPTHIGMLPVAVNIQCHSSRHTTIVI